MLCKEPLLKDCIPKKATQHEEFSKKYPEYDGRGVKIAIIDCPVDVSMPILQKTSVGLPKIIDCYNFSQNGKINTPSISEVDGDNILIGLTGKKLKIPSTWKNPSGKWHLGFKDYHKMFPKYPTTEKKAEKNDTEELEEKLNRTLKIKGSNKKIFIDFIVWHNGKKWQACATTSEMNLENEKVLANFCDEHEFGFINNNFYCVTINEDGNFINVFHQINDQYSDHGTIVANVAAGYVANESDSNGLAPGAQIIPMTATNSDEMKKALLKCIEIKVDIINISIGFSYSNSIAKVLKAAVEKHGILIFNAVPNKGPVYLSINEHSSCAFDQLFNIGSIMPHEIKNQFIDKKEEEGPSKLCLFSGRGPSITGGKGVDLVAPGVIYSTYPYRFPTKNGLYFGSSGAAPYCAGSVACLLTALKANSIEYSPTILKLVLSNTAYLPEGGDPLGYGNGIIQINSAFEYFKTFSKILPKNFEIPKLEVFEKKSTVKLNHINLIQKDCNGFCKNYCVKINEFNNDEITTWVLKITPGGEKFVEFSDTVTDGMFTVNINTYLLNPGTINFAEILGFNSSNISFGPLFKLPITVIIPKFVTEKNGMQKEEIVLYREIPYNIFLNFPCERSKCIITLTALEEMTDKIYFQYVIKRFKGDTIGDTKACKITPKQNCASFSIPSVLYNQMFAISIYRYNYYKRIPENLKFDLEVIFQKCQKRK